MSKAILIIGESGAGKTTSLRNLPPKETFYIDADKKGLSWKGWKQQYIANTNYLRTSNAETIKNTLLAINTKAPHIKYVVIDTLNAVMIDNEFSRMKEKGYDKWMDLAYAIYDIVDLANTLREDLTIICLAHAQVERDDTGYSWTHMKTSGKKLDKIVVESKFTTVLLAKAVEGDYIFEVRANNSTAKTPMGAFDSDTIPNDITLVIEALKEF
jgi:hypothetical protein